MKYSLFICLFCTLLLTNCNSTSSEDENTYSINVTNSLELNIDIYTQLGEEGTAILQGSISSGATAEYTGFEIDQYYILTATNEGGSPDNWYYQTEFTGESTSALEISISPQF